MYEKYLEWDQRASKKSKEEMFHIPLGNYDVYEDQSIVINHLYYLIPGMDGEKDGAFVFYEANTFVKDGRGDLSLAYSTLGVPSFSR